MEVALVNNALELEAVVLTAVPNVETPETSSEPVTVALPVTEKSDAVIEAPVIVPPVQRLLLISTSPKVSILFVLATVL